MSVETKVGSLTVPAAPGSQVITGVGFTPKAILFWSTGSDKAMGTWSNGYFCLMGMSTGPTNSYAICTAGQAGLSTTETARRMVDAAITFTNTAATDTIAQAQISAFSSDGFTLNWTNLTSMTGTVVHYMVIGGSDITGAKVVNWTFPLSVGTSSVTGVGFKPDLVFHMGTGDATGVPPKTNGHAIFAFGAMNKHGQQWANGYYSADAVSPTNTGRWQNVDACFGRVWNATLDAQAHFVSMDPDGFTTMFSTVTGAANNAFSLCLQGVSSKIGSFVKTQVAGANGPQTIERTEFNPRGLLVTSQSDQQRGDTSVQAYFQVGATDGSDQRTAGMQDTHTSNPSNSKSAYRNDALISEADGMTSTGEWTRASFTSFNPDGFSLTWPINLVYPAEYLYLAIGDAGVNPTPVSIRANSTAVPAHATGPGTQRKLDRCQNGNLWASYDYAGTAAANGVALLQCSTDDGLTWSSGEYVFNGSGGSTTTSTRNFSFFIDIDDYAHIAFKDNSNGFLYYRRGTPNASRTAWTWSSAVEIYAYTTGNFPDLVAHREGTGWAVHIVASMSTPTSLYADYARLKISSAQAITIDHAFSVIAGPYTTTTQLECWPSIDFNHTGDGKSVAASPHLYASWSAGKSGAGFGIRFKRATYSGGAWTWGAEREITPNYFSDSWARNAGLLFDGTRVIIGGSAYKGATTEEGQQLYERDAADTTTTILSETTGATTTLNREGSMTYDGDGNVYLIGRGNNQQIVYRKYDRKKGVMQDAVNLYPTGFTGPYLSARRGHWNGNIEWVFIFGNNAPYSVKYDRIRLTIIGRLLRKVLTPNGRVAEIFRARGII